jgi:hypothetical protein
VQPAGVHLDAVRGGRYASCAVTKHKRRNE